MAMTLQDIARGADLLAKVSTLAGAVKDGTGDPKTVLEGMATVAATLCDRAGIPRQIFCDAVLKVPSGANGDGQ